jgi:tellurite resistance protein TerC
MLSTSSLWLWIIFLIGVTAMLFVDLFVVNRKPHKPTTKEATIQSLVWIGLSLVVGAIIWGVFGADHGAPYFTAYIIEKSLSVDNIFVWGLVLAFFKVPEIYKHKVLFWGIFGAIVMRFVFIASGVQLVSRFDFLVPMLGLVLLWSAIKIFRSGDDDYSVEDSKPYKFFSKYIPVSRNISTGRFFIKEKPVELDRTSTSVIIKPARTIATTLFLCLLVVEATDVIFAVDSVPAVLSVSSDTFVIFASNVMAILGLRSLFFLFDAIKDKFRFLSIGIAIVLASVGIKMLLQSNFWFLPGVHIPTVVSLLAVFFILTTSVVLSMVIKEKK